MNHIIHNLGLGFSSTFVDFQFQTSSGPVLPPAVWWLHFPWSYCLFTALDGVVYVTASLEVCDIQLYIESKMAEDYIVSKLLFVSHHSHLFNWGFMAAQGPREIISNMRTQGKGFSTLPVLVNLLYQGQEWGSLPATNPVVLVPDLSIRKVVFFVLWSGTSATTFVAGRLPHWMSQTLPNPLKCTKIYYWTGSIFVHG